MILLVIGMKILVCFCLNNGLVLLCVCMMVCYMLLEVLLMVDGLVARSFIIFASARGKSSRLCFMFGVVLLLCVLKFSCVC